MEIEWENPPTEALMSPREYNEQFIAALRCNPGNWAVYKRGVRQRATKMSMIKRYPDISWKSALEEDGTYTIWARTKED